MLLKWIETERLLLRKWKDSDTKSFFLMNRDLDVMKYFPELLTDQQSLELINQINQHFDDWGYGTYAVELKESRSFIGFIGLSHPRFENDFTPCIEIGWRLSKDMWGKGLATEGALAVLKYAFTKLGIESIYAFTTINNRASEKVMKKIGMKKLGSFFHPNLPAEHTLSKHYLYKILSGDFLLSDQ